MNLSKFIQFIAITLTFLACLFAVSFFVSPNYFTHTIIEKNVDEEKTNGQKYYESYCSTCHGAQGKGDGPSSITLNKLPAKFSSSSMLQKLNQDKIYKIIEEGIPNSQMPAFHYLPNNIKQQIAQYVIFLRDYENVQ